MKRRTFLQSVVGFVSAEVVLSTVPGHAALTPEPYEASGDFLKTAGNLKRKGGIVVGVFRDSTFSGHEVPAALDFDAFRKSWGANADVHIVPLDKNEIRSFSILFRGHLDILVYPYGALYPMDAFPWYTGDTIEGFLQRGGAILTTGGVPFGQPVNDDGKTTNKGTPDSLSLDPVTYRRFVAPFGFKYYVSPHRPPHTAFDRSFLPALPAELDFPAAQLGVVVNNSSHFPVPKPYHGNVFPERYPARNVIPLMWGEDGYGRTLAVNGVLVQDFENGSRRIHFTHEEEPHPLNPNSLTFQPLMQNLLTLLCSRVVVKDVSTDYACYRHGETVTVRAEFVSFENTETDAEVVLEIRSGDTVVDTHHETVRFPLHRSAWKEWKWSPPSFEADEYTVCVGVMRGHQHVSRGQNGFVVWKEEVVKQGPAVSLGKDYFRKSDGEAFLTGTNYYESTRGEIMWFRPDVSRICADFRSMRECGVNYIRPHYHHLKWFKDYLEFQHGRLLPYFESLQSVNSPVPDERTWRMLDVFIYLCQKYGIIYGGDLFTLVPEEMGDPRGWLPMIEGVVCAEKRAAAKKFFRAINERYNGVPGIAWDLWNEPHVPLPLLKTWVDDMRQELSGLYPNRLLTVGGGWGMKLDDSVDYLGIHIGAKDLPTRVNNFARPALAQEVYLDHDEDLSSELVQAEDMRKGMFGALRNGFAGFAPWSWTRQMRLWQDSYEHDPDTRMESWDDRLGAQVHDDGTLKPAGQVYRDIATVLRLIPFKSYNRHDRSIATDSGELRVTLEGIDGAACYSLFHLIQNRCISAISLSSITWSGTTILAGPDNAYVYAMSDGDDLKRAKRLLFKSESPGRMVLYGRTSPRSIALADVSPIRIQKLKELRWSIREDLIEVVTEPTDERYWVVAEWNE